MVHEIRKIILTKGELAMALNAYRKVEPNYIPGGRVLACDVPNDEQVDLAIETLEENKIKLKHISLLPARLTAPIIQFCIEQHIMLPRKGHKAALLLQRLPLLFIELETQPVVDFDR
jgi:hypothetical protein